MKSGMITTVNMRKDSTALQTMQKAMTLRDSKGISKTKIHEFRQLFPESISPVSSVTKEEKVMNELIRNKLKINDSAPDEFHVDPLSWVRHLIELRGLDRVVDDVIHILLEADGRGTGSSFHSIILQMRLLNEGPTLFRNDRAYLLSLVVGKESHAVFKDKLGAQLKALEELQKNGFRRKSDGKLIKVKLYLVSDAKFAQLAHGMIRFCDKGCHCLYCRMHSDEIDNLDKTWKNKPKAVWTCR
jgi:hypothetical protein